MGIPWDGTGINCYGMGMGQINMSHGQPCVSHTVILDVRFTIYGSYLKINFSNRLPLN